jgi:3-dehydroquinate synthase
MQTLKVRNTEVLFPENTQQIKTDIFRNSRVFVICDTQTKKHCLPVFNLLFPDLKYTSYVMPDGESSKSLKETDRIVNFFLSHQLNRNDIVAGLGGGVVCDITGFVSSIYKRGVHCIYFPTTLLAMVDAAIGGKNGIDFKGFKNIFGTFYDPESVVIYTPFLTTLDKRHLESGKAEIIKTMLLGNKNEWESFAKKKQITISAELIKQCAEIKSVFVEKDYYDRKERNALNFGHTLGHAIEAYSISRYPVPLLHGEAVAAGLICELYLSHVKSGLDISIMNKATAMIRRIFEPVPADCLKYDHLKKYLEQDKKNARPGTPTFTLLKDIGNPLIKQECSITEIKQALKFYSEVHAV